jgi:hypothetical protein
MSSESLAERLYAKTISLTCSAPDRSLTPQKCHEALAAEALAWMQEIACEECRRKFDEMANPTS